MDEKFDKALECCINGKCDECPLFPELNCDGMLIAEVEKNNTNLEERLAIMQESMEALEKRCNALEALEERNEPIKPTLNESHSYVSDAFKCGKCGHTIRFHAKYCEDCGQRVSWND